MQTASQPKLTPVQGAHLTIEKVLFTSSKEATQLMNGEDPGLPGDAQVCVVLLNGPFQVQVDLPPDTPESTAPIATNVGVVFDAHTGNLLEWAVLDSFLGSSSTHAYAQPTTQSVTPNISYSCNSRCHGTNYWPNPVNGAYTYLNWPYPNITRFYYGNAFVQNTMWLLDETSSNCPGVCWVEAGLRAYEVNGSNATVLFWADQRPGYGYADHYGAVVNTLNSTCCIDIQIWKAGTISGVGWCPTADSEWCVDLYSETDHKEWTGISGAGGKNTMKVSGYQEGMELYGSSGAYASPMGFDYNMWESTSNNSWNYQGGPGNYGKYVDNYPVDSYWNDVPAGSSNDGGEWVTCITRAGCNPSGSLSGHFREATSEATAQVGAATARQPAP